MIVAGIDGGTNYGKLSIISTQPFQILFQKSVKYSIGKSLDENKNIPDEKIEEVADIFKDFADIAKQYKCAEIKAVGTAGFRNPRNSQALIDRIYDKSGIKVRVINGMEEAKLTYKGALLSFDDKDANYVEIDIGGMSTEISSGRLDYISKSKSIDIGSSSLSKQFTLENKVLNEGDLNGILTFLDRKFNGVSVPSTPNTIFILTGSAGFAPIMFKDNSLDDEKIKAKPIWSIGHKTVETLMRTIMKQPSFSKNFSNDSDIVLAQCIVLYFLMNKFNIDKLFYSTLGLRHGLVLFS